MNLRVGPATVRSAVSGRSGRLLRVGVVVAILAYLFHGIDVGAALDRMHAADPLVVLAATSALVAVHALAALTWREIAVRLGEPMPVRSAIGAYYASQALGGITPANLGGDAYRIVAQRGGEGGWGTAAAAVLIQRSTSFVALVALGVVALVALPDVTRLAGPLVAIAAIVASAFAAPTLVVVRRARRAFAGRSRRPIGAAVLFGLGGGLAFHAIGIVAGYALVLAVDPSCSGVPALAAVALARLSLAVPIAPSGIGVQEGAMAALFVALGLAPESAVAATLLGRIALAVTTGLGLAAIVAGRSSRATMAGERGIRRTHGTLAPHEAAEQVAVPAPR